jgi:uncharacterized membrane protein
VKKLKGENRTIVKKMKNIKEILRVILAVSIIVVGITHFVLPEQYVKIVPPQLPYPLGLVYLSGFYEILGGIGLLVPPLSEAAAWGLIALFIAVFPANINMAVNLIKIDHIPNSPWVHVVRLPFQAVLIAWAWWYTQPQEAEKQASIIPKSLIPKELNTNLPR